MKPKLRVTQVRSGIGRPEKHRKVLAALGLRGPNRSVVVANTPDHRGQIKKVIHLVTVEEMQESPKATAAAPGGVRAAGAGGPRTSKQEETDG